MSKNNLFNVELHINTSPLFVGTAALLTLGLKVQPSDDLGKISKLMIEAGYLPWLRDAAKDPTVETFINQVTEAAQQSVGEGNEPNFEAAVSALSSELLNYYGGILGITDGIATDKAKSLTTIRKAVQGIRQIDHIREVIEDSMPADELARANEIKEAMRRGEITQEEALRRAGAPEELVQAMGRLFAKLTGKTEPEAETETQGG